MKQLRASGGIWFGKPDGNTVIDPGPGSLVRICQAFPPLDPETIQAILVTHKHIDHSTDLNVLTEAMTGGGFKDNGTVLLPGDMMDEHQTYLLDYLRKKVNHLHVWREGEIYDLPGGGTVEPVRLRHHRVECYGFIHRHDEFPPIGFISDTALDEEWLQRFRGCELIVANMTLPRPRPSIEHLSPSEIDRIIEVVAPKRLILTHLGRGVLREGPEMIAARLSRPMTNVIAARDGMVVDLQSLDLRFS